MSNINLGEPTREEVLSGLSFSKEEMDEMVATIQDDFNSHSSASNIRGRIRQGIKDFDWPRIPVNGSSGPTIADYIAERVEWLMDQPMDD